MNDKKYVLGYISRLNIKNWLCKNYTKKEAKERLKEAKNADPNTEWIIGKEVKFGNEYKILRVYNLFKHLQVLHAQVYH